MRSHRWRNQPDVARVLRQQKNEDFVQLRKEAYTAAVVTVGMGELHLKLALLKEGAVWESLHTASASMRRSSEMGLRMRDPQVSEPAFPCRILRLCRRLAITSAPCVRILAEARGGRRPGPNDQQDKGGVRRRR
jgi:hypothetical protein